MRDLIAPLSLAVLCLQICACEDSTAIEVSPGKNHRPLTVKSGSRQKHQDRSLFNEAVNKSAQIDPYFDLEKEGDNSTVNSKRPLELRIYPVQIERTALVVRVEVWNVSQSEQRVLPLDCFDYFLTFVDSQGKEIQAYNLPPTNKVLLERGKMVPIMSGTCVAANYLIPTFYERIKKPGMNCRVSASANYYVGSIKNVRRFSLSSDLAPVPKLLK